MGSREWEYLLGRRNKRHLVYRLRRRTEEVGAAIRRYQVGQLRTLVDVGTADGLMLDRLREYFGPLSFIGVDSNSTLLRTPRLNGIQKVQADAQALPVKSGVADVVIATAVIEHVPDARSMLRECNRILRPNGLLIATTPDPLIEWIASAIGLLNEPGHQQTFNLRQLCGLVEFAGFKVIESRKFMFSPIGFPAERTIERLLNTIGLSFVMANQLLVAKKS